MTPQTLLQHNDTGTLWSEPLSATNGFDLSAAYRSALTQRKLREARGESPRGFKIGFTNRTIWQRYGVYAPIWGTVYDSTLSFCDGQGRINLAATCQPRIEPELVFGMKATPPANASLEQLFAALDWLAPGFEIVQSHLPDWKFKAADTVADGGLHARLLVGRRIPIGALASSATQLNSVLAETQVSLLKADQLVDQGCGANVLDSPLHALLHFLTELRQCPDAPDLLAGDVITTGTWTDAWPVLPGEHWHADFSAPLSRLDVEFD